MKAKTITVNIPANKTCPICGKTVAETEKLHLHTIKKQDAKRLRI
jgi:ribosomal protein S17